LPGAGGVKTEIPNESCDPFGILFLQTLNTSAVTVVYSPGRAESIAQSEGFPHPQVAWKGLALESLHSGPNLDKAAS